MPLSIRDILLLDFLDGKPAHTKVPAYQYKIYGDDADDRVAGLLAEGYLRYSRPQETVTMEPDRVLSTFLEQHGLSGEGSHGELVKRVVESVPENDYAHAVPKVYVLTKEGSAEVGRHMAYVLNARENYGLTEGEIGESQKALAARGEPYTARTILYRAFQQKMSLYTMAGEWSKLRNLYYTVANFYIRLKHNEYALPYLYLVFFMDMSGMGNRNNLVPYENLFPTQKGMILLMNEIRKEQKLTLEDVRGSFLSSIARMAPRLPFSYFSPQVMAGMLIERLRGYEFNPTKYMVQKNTPDPTSKSYHYVPYGRSEARPARGRVQPVKPKLMAPPVLRMPTFTAPPPFKPRETRLPASLVPKPAPAPVEEPAAEEPEKKGLLAKIRKLLRLQA